MPKINSNNLGYLGTDFQYKLVKCFFEDRKFFSSINHIVDQNMFTEDALRRIVGLMKDRYIDREVVSTYFDIETIIRSKISDNTTVSIMLATLDTIKNMPLDGMDLVEEETEKFFKQQNLTKAINQSMDIIKKGNSSDYYVIEDIVRKALETNTKQDFGFRVFDCIEADLADDYRQPIPTGTPQLDESLYGGLGKGELGLIVAPMGTGKALPLTARVLTPDGYVLMGAIRKGDKVIGSDGKAHTVLGVFPQVGKRPIYTVKFSNGTTCECDAEHLWSVKEDGESRYKTMTTKEIMNRSGYKLFSIPNCAPVEFNPYSDYHESGINVQPVHPRVFDTIEKRRAFMRHLLDTCGYVDGNGDVWFHPDVEYSEKNMRWLVLSLGGSVDMFPKFMKLYIPQEYAFQLFSDEKLNSRVYFREDVPEISIISVTYERDDYAQCIMVDSPDHLYVVEDFIVTHNTSIVTGFAASAATTQCEANNFNGYKVLHYFHEDEEAAIRRKYFGYVLDIDACELHKPGTKQMALQALTENQSLRPLIQNNIRCKRLVTGETTASQIRDMIRANIASGFKPDLVVIDYFECLKAEKSTAMNESEWSKEGVTMRKLEAICHEFNVAIWVPVQGTKNSIGEEFVGLQHAGGSVTKTQIGHVVLTLARTENQKSQHRLNLYIQKLRAVRIGRDKFMNVRFNNGTCRFDMDDIASDSDVDFDNPQSPNIQAARAVSGSR